MGEAPSYRTPLPDKVFVTIVFRMVAEDVASMYMPPPVVALLASMVLSVMSARDEFSRPTPPPQPVATAFWAIRFP